MSSAQPPLQEAGAGCVNTRAAEHELSTSRGAPPSRPATGLTGRAFVI
jgi:hypothetical protein